VKSVIRDNVISFWNDKRKLIIFIVFAWVCGDELVLANSLDMSLFEYLLFVIGNHYYLIYFLLMSYIFFQFDIIKKETNCITIRMNSIKRKYLCQLISVFVQTSIYIFLHIILALVIGATKLKIVNEFQTKVVEGYYNDTLSLIYGYNEYFSNPLLALVAVVFYLIIGLTVIGMLIYAIREIWGSKMTLICSGLLILDIMLGFKLSIRGLAEVFCVNNYFILHHVLFKNGWLYTSINILIGVISLVGIYVVLKRKKSNKVQTYNYARNMFTNIYQISGLFIAIYVGLNLLSVKLGNEQLCFTDGIINNLAGYSISNFSLLEFVRHILFYAVPLFLIGSVLEKEKHMYNNQVAIRYKTRKQWKNLLYTNISKFIFWYIFFFILILGILRILDVLMKNVNQNYLDEFILYTGINQKQLVQIIILSVVLKLLELVYYKNLLIVVNDISGNSIFSYVFTLLGFLLPFITRSWFVSYGKSSLFFLAESIKNIGIENVALLLIGVISIKNGIVKLISYMWRNKNESSDRS